MTACVRNFIGVMVETLAVLVLATSLVVGEHTQTVLHGEDLVVNTTVVSVLVAEVVEALP